MASSIYDNEARKTDRAKNLAAQQQTTASIIKKNLEASKASDGTVKKTVYEESQYVTPSSSGSTAPKTVTTPKTSAGSSLTGDSAVDALIAPEEVIAQDDEEEEYEEEEYEEEVYEEEPEEPVFTPYESRSSAVNIVTGTKPQAAARIANQKAELTALNEQESKKPEEPKKDDDIYNNPGRQADRAENLAAWQEELDARETEKANAAESAVSEYIEADNTGSVFKEEELRELSKYLSGANENEEDYESARIMLDEGAMRAALLGDTNLQVAYENAVQKLDRNRASAMENAKAAQEAEKLAQFTQEAQVYARYLDDPRSTEYAEYFGSADPLTLYANDREMAAILARVQGIADTQGDQAMAYGETPGLYELVQNMMGKNDTAKEYSWVQTDAGRAGIDSLSTMTNEERTVFYTILATEGTEKAKEFIDFLDDELKRRRAEQAAGEIAEFTQDYPLMGALASVGQTPYKMAGAVDAMLSPLFGKEIDPYSSAYDANVMQGAARGTNIAQIEEAIDSDFWEKAAVAAYNAAMSGADSLAASGLPGGAGAAMLASGAASDAAYDAKLRGATDAQAVALAGLAGSVEFLFEKYDLEKLGVLARGETDGFWKAVGKQFLTEGVGEGLTEAANEIADRAIMHEASTFETAVRQYILSGMTMEEARARAAQESAGRVMEATITGAFSGGASAFAAGAPSAISNFVRSDAFQNYIDRQSQMGIVAPGFEGDAQTRSDSAVEALVNPQGVLNELPDSDESTSVNTDPSQHTPVEQAVIDEYQNSVDEGLVQYVEDVKNDQVSYREKYELNPVSDRAAADIKTITGVDATGFKTAIERKTVEHILNRHGENGAHDKSMRDVNDIARIQYILDNYDDIADGGSVRGYTTVKANGKPGLARSVVYSKAVNGTFYVVEAVPDTKSRTAYIVSAYMSKNGQKKGASHLTDTPMDAPVLTADTGVRDNSTEPAASADGTGPVPATTEQLSGSNNSIAVSAPAVNPIVRETAPIDAPALDPAVQALIDPESVVNEPSTELQEPKANPRTTEQRLRDEAYTERWKAAETDLAARMHEGRELAQQRRILEERVAQEVRHRQERVAQIRETSKAADLRKNISREVSALTTTLRHPTTKKFVPQSLQDTVSQFVNAVDIASSKDGQETQKAQAWKDRLSDLADYLEKVNKAEADKNGRYVELDYSDDAFVNQIKTFVSGIDGKATISQMSAQQLQELSEITNRVVEMVRMADKVILNGKEMQISSAASRMIRDMWTSPKARNIAFRTMTDTGMIDPKRFFEQFGDVGQKLYESLLAGQRDYAAGMMQARAVFEQAAQKYHLNDWYNKRGDEFTFTTTSGQEITIGRGEALSIYASFKREEASGDAKNNHLTNGGFIYGDSKKRDNDAGAHKLSAEDKRKIVDNYLTSEQKQFADTIINYMSTELAAIGNATSLAQNGVKKFIETAYFPYRVSSDYIPSGSAKNQADQTALLKNKGFTKETVQNATAPVMLDDFLSVFDRHTNEMLQYAAMSIPQDSISKVFGYRSFEDGKGGQTSLRNEMAKAYGDKAGQYLDDFIKQLSGSMTGGQSIGVADTLMRNVKVASVLANAQVIIQQPSAGLRALAMVDPKYFIGKPHTGSFDEAAMYSGTAFVKKVGGYDVGTTSGAAGWLTDTTGMQNLAGKAGSFFTDTEYRNDILGKGAQLADNLTWGRIWEAVKRETADKTNLTGEELLEKAGERFDQVIDATQVYDSVLTKSGLMRSQNTFMKMATAYMSEPTKMLNMIAGAASGKGNVSLGRAVGAVAASQIANILLKSLTRAMRDDDEWQNFGEKYVEALLATAFGVGEGLDKIPYIGEHLGFLASDLSPLSMIPWAQDVLSVFQGYDVERMDMSLIADFANVLSSLDDENKTSGEKLLDLSGAIANLFGVPATNVLRDMEGFYRTLKTAFTGGIDMMSDSRLLYEAGMEPNKKGMQEELDAARAAMQSGMSREEALSLVAEMDELKTQFDDLDVLGVFDKNEFYTDFLNSKGLSTEAAQAFLNAYLSDSAMDNTMVSSEGQAYTFENDPDLYWANAAGFETIDDIARVLDELADVKSDMITQDKYLSDPAALMAAYVDKMNEMGLDASQQDYILKRMNDMDAKSPSDKMTDDALKIYAQGAFGLTDQQYHDYFEAGGVSFNQDGIDLLLSGMNDGVFTKDELGMMTDAAKYATTAKGVDMDGDGRADTDSIRNEQMQMYIDLGLDENQMRLMFDYNDKDVKVIDDMETAGRYGVSNQQYMDYFVNGENAMSLNSEDQEAMLKAYKAGTFKDLDTMANQVNAFNAAQGVDADGNGETDTNSKRDARVQALLDAGADSAQIAAIMGTQYESSAYADAMQKAEKSGISPQDFAVAFKGAAAESITGNLDGFIESQKKEVGMDAQQFADALAIASDTKGVIGENGKTISGSKKYNVYTELKEMGLSDSQIEWFMTQRKGSDGEPMYKNMEIDYAPEGAPAISAGSADTQGKGGAASTGTAAATSAYGASKHDLTKGDIKRRNTAIPNYVKNMGVDEKNAAVLWDGLYTIEGEDRNVKRMEYLKEAGFSEKAIAWIWNAPQSEGGFGYKSDYRKYYGASSGEAWDSGGSGSWASSSTAQKQNTQNKAQMQQATQSFMQRWGLTGNPFGTSSGGMNYSGYASLLGLTQQAAKRLYDTIPLLAPLGGSALVSHLRGMGLTDQAISRLWKMPIDQGGLGRTDDLNQYLAA